MVTEEKVKKKKRSRKGKKKIAKQSVNAQKVENAGVHQNNEVVDHAKTREDAKMQDVVDAPEKNRGRPR